MSLTWLKGEKTSFGDGFGQRPWARRPSERMEGEGISSVDRCRAGFSGETSCGLIARPPGEARTWWRAGRGAGREGRSGRAGHASLRDRLDAEELSALVEPA